MVLDEATIKNDQRFLHKNVAIDPSGINALFSSRSYCYEMRVYRGNFYQVDYQTTNIEDNKVFDVEGMEPGHNMGD